MLTIRVKQLSSDELEISFRPVEPRVRERMTRTDMGITRCHQAEEFSPRKDGSPIRAAAVELRQFLAGVEKRPAMECIAHLKARGFDPENLNLTRIRRAANVEAQPRDRQWFWFLPPTPEMRAMSAGV
jgi:hypothetical protein